MDLSPTAQKFILHWGEMGAKWGINRTVAQIHALLYISEKPLNAEEIMEYLGIARSNASNSLHELQNWGIVKVVHVFGDRRDHFESMKDVWEMFRIILDERKKRETDPTLQLLRECRDEFDEASAYEKERIENMLNFFEVMTDWYGYIQKLPTNSMIKLAKMGSKIPKWITGSKK